jgi:hypothetical protein
MAQYHGWLRAERTDHVDELDDTEAAFTALVLGMRVKCPPTSLTLRKILEMRTQIARSG